MKQEITHELSFYSSLNKLLKSKCQSETELDVLEDFDTDRINFFRIENWQEKTTGKKSDDPWVDVRADFTFDPKTDQFHVKSITLEQISIYSEGFRELQHETEIHKAVLGRYQQNTVTIKHSCELKVLKTIVEEGIAFKSHDDDPKFYAQLFQTRKK